MRNARFFLCSVAMVFLAAVLGHAASPVTQRLIPASHNESETRPAPAPLVVTAPGDVEISIEITPTTDSHELRVYADSGSFYRSTTIGLKGEDSDPLHSFTWHAFPVGDYEVVGMLVSRDGTSEVVVRGALRVVDR